MAIRTPDHPSVDDQVIPYRAPTVPPAPEEGASNVAGALGDNERQMVKTLIFETKQAERVLVLVGGNQSAISCHLKKALGSRNIKLAAPEVVKETTGYEIGSIPPFHWQPEGFRSFLEASLLAEEVLGVGAGRWGYEIMITPQNLVKACRAIVVNLTDKSQPVRAA